MKNSSLPGTPAEKRSFFTGILCAPQADEKLRELAESGVLEKLFPEISAMRGVSQPPEFHPEGDVFEHTMLMLRHMVFPDPLLGWSVLLHDVGKPLTRSVEASGRIRFFGHEEKGALLAAEILERFEFEKTDMELIVHAVRNHMRFAHVTDMRQAKLEKLMRSVSFPLELELHRLDCISCHGKMEGFDHLLGKYLLLAPPEPEKLVSGRDLKERGIGSGVLCGTILREIRKVQLSGKINTRKEALEYMEKLISERNKTI